MAVPSIGQMGETCGALLNAHAGLRPCVIVGYCVNGKIAFEAAHAVLRGGGRVAAVVLFDTIAAMDLAPRNDRDGRRLLHSP